MGRGWIKVSGGDHNRKVNDILGPLCRLHFPGLVQFYEEQVPAYTWDHYVATPDVPDRDRRRFTNIAERVKGEQWVSIPRTTLLNTSPSLDILEIITLYIASICKTSTDARRDSRPRRSPSLNKPPRSS